MLLQIDGWFGAGKSVLWMLLDGHPDVFCSPIHDYSYSAFLNQSDELDWVKTRHTEILRKALARTQYYKFEKVYWDGYMSFEFSTSDVLKIPYSINYYSFDHRFIKHLIGLSSWSLEGIIDSLYASIREEVFQGQRHNDNNMYYASMSNPLFINDYPNSPMIFPHGKSIQVRRSVEEIIAVRSNRKPRPEDFKTWTFFSDSFDKRINEGEVEKILNYYTRYDSLVEEYPDYFMVIDFNDLISNTGIAMNKVSDFLNISWNDVLLNASYQGAELVCNGKKYVGQVNDKIEDLLSAEEVGVIRKRKDLFYKNI
jgi:hypothetical protein